MREYRGVSTPPQELIELLPHLAEQGIAVNYERQDDVLEQPLIRSLELVARTVVALHNNQLDTANSLLPELVAHSAFNFTATDIWKLSLHAYKNNSLWLESMLTNSVFNAIRRVATGAGQKYQQSAARRAN